MGPSRLTHAHPLHVIYRSILVLGAGLVVKPLVQYMNKHGYKVILASRTLAKAEALVKGCTHAVAMKLDIETEEGEKLLDQQAQLVTAIVSLLPYLFHPKAAQYALKYESGVNVHTC